MGIGNIKFIWLCPFSGRIRSNFENREPHTESASFNRLVFDMEASFGSGIVAAASGIVTISTYSYSAGNYIMIYHGGGVYTVHMHCPELLTLAGQESRPGR